LPAPGAGRSRRGRSAPSIGPAIVVAREVVDPAFGLEGDVVVEVDLQAALAGAGLDHAQHGVEIVLVFLRVLPVGRPAEVGRIDVGGQPLLEAVQLVRTDEVHLAGQHRAIARKAQVVREGRHGRGKLGGVVVGLYRRGQLPGQHGKARRRTERRIAVGVVEDHAALGQRRDTRRLDHRMAIDRQGRRSSSRARS
jgi:hypothetical protein